VTLKFGTDGVRGVALVELTAPFTTALGAAAATVIGGERWIVGRDPRESGPELESALASGLASCGASVELLGVVPTPALAFIGARDGVPAAMITASHNRFTDNGVKFFAAGGSKLPDDVEQAIESATTTELASSTPERVAGGVTLTGGAVRAYVDHLVALFPPDALAGVRLTLDCGERRR
jgi:phosphoglucosamine mutase